MNSIKRSSLILASAFLCLSILQAKEPEPLSLEKIKLPPGFHISVYARVDNARSMVLSPSGILYVGNRDNGAVYAVLPSTTSRKSSKGSKPSPVEAGQVIQIAKGLNMPNGVAFKNGTLYVAEVSRILKYRDIETHLFNPEPPSVMTDKYPTDRSHGWKFIAFGPDERLYVPVGAPCNICESKDPVFGSITRLETYGTGREIYARGIRNTVGFDWDPETKELWFTDNGRDQLGDDIPPDELNHAPKSGLHFGYPYCHGGTIIDPDLGKRTGCDGFEKPAANFQAHVAALGMRFYTGKMFPKEYYRRIFVAQHGSWNRSKKQGYCVMMVPIVNGKAGKPEVFAEGWLQGEEVWGRPVDVLVMPDGALLVSDDFSGTIYRITYGG